MAELAIADLQEDYAGDDNDCDSCESEYYDDVPLVPDPGQQAPLRSVVVHRHTAPEGPSDRLYMEAVLIPISRDNQCLFQAILFLASEGAPESTASDLRKTIAEAIMRDPQAFSEVHLGMPRTDYCTWIQNASNWGGETEIVLLSEHFNVEIQVIVMGETPTSLVYGEIFAGQRHHTGRARSGRIFLLYSGQHYDAIVGHEKLGDTVITSIRRFPTGESEMCSLALACGMTVFQERQRAQDDEHSSIVAAVMATDVPSSRPSETRRVALLNRFGEPEICFKNDVCYLKYLEKCRAMVSNEVHAQNVEVIAGEGLQEVEDRIQSLRLALQLTEEEFIKEQDRDKGRDSFFIYLDAETIAGIGLHFSQFIDGLGVEVSRVLELSAANFADVRKGDILQQIDDKKVTCREDCIRCLGALGSMVHLKFVRSVEGTVSKTGPRVEFWRSIIREIKASRKPEEEYLLRSSDVQDVQLFSNYLHTSPPSPKKVGTSTRGAGGGGTNGVSDLRTQEACRFVMQSGFLDFLRPDTSGLNSLKAVGNLMVGTQRMSEWVNVQIRITPAGFLVVDNSLQSPLLGCRYFPIIAWASLPPDAAVDLQEIQLINLTKHATGSSKVLEASRCFEVHLHDYSVNYAYSQHGLMQAHGTKKFQFRAQDAHEANMWVKGINSVVSHFPTQVGVRVESNRVRPKTHFQNTPDPDPDPGDILV